MKNILIALCFLMVGSYVNASEMITLSKDNTITLNDAFYGDTVSKLAKKAKELDARTESSDPIYLVLNSPGGSIDAGLELIENLNSLRRPVKTITVFSASMGFQTVQGVKGERLVTQNGTLMSHKASGGFDGEFPGQLDSRYAYWLKRVTRMNEQAVKRTNGKLTLQSYNNLIENEYWCDGQECVDKGFADRVASAQCDKSLEGVRKEVWYRDIFMGMVLEIVVTLDKCPLNTNVMSYNYYIDGQPVFPERDEDGNTEADKDPKTTEDQDNYYSYRSHKEDKKMVTPEMIAEVRSKLDRVLNDRKARKVIKGY